MTAFALRKWNLLLTRKRCTIIIIETEGMCVQGPDNFYLKSAENEDDNKETMVRYREYYNIPAVI